MLMSVSDAFSGFEDSIASCLVGWLALRLKYQRPADIISELSELLRANQKELQKVIAPRTIGTLRPSMPTAFGPVFSSGKNQIPHGPSNKLKGTRGSPSFQSIRSLTHRRCFSFLPGDDSTNPILFDASGGQDRESDMNLIRHLVWQDTRQSDRGGSGEFAKNEVSGGLAVGSTSQQRLRNSVAPSTAGSDTIRNPRRHGSGKSVLTAIISSSS